MDMEKTFTCGFSVILFRVLVFFLPFYAMWIYFSSSSSLNGGIEDIMFFILMILFLATPASFQYMIPLEIKTNVEGMIVRRWKKEKFYAWKDVKILFITKILSPFGRLDFHLLSEPFHKRYLMILGLNRKQRKELMQIVKQGIESYKGCS